MNRQKQKTLTPGIILLEPIQKISAPALAEKAPMHEELIMIIPQLTSVNLQSTTFCQHHKTTVAAPHSNRALTILLLLRSFHSIESSGTLNPTSVCPVQINLAYPKSAFKIFMYVLKVCVGQSETPPTSATRFSYPKRSNKARHLKRCSA